MNHLKVIEESFASVGYTPRAGQFNAVESILDLWFTGKTTVMLSAPTGTGKSVIGAVAAEAAHRILNPDQGHNAAGASFILTATNVLSEQYRDSFIGSRIDADIQTMFRSIKGSNNFDCLALSSQSDEIVTAESCAIRMFEKTGIQDVVDEFCGKCEFIKQRKMRDKARHLIANYAYYFIDRMYVQAMPTRTVTVWDEAHLLNDLFTDHNAIFFNETRLLQLAKEIGDHLHITDTTVFGNIKRIREDLAAGKITEDTFPKYLEHLAEIYGIVTEVAQGAAERNISNYSRYITYSKLSKKYSNFSCKIADFLTYGYESVFEYKPRDKAAGQPEHEVTIKPLFVGDMFNSILLNSKFQLIMSATLSENYCRRTMKLGNEAAYLKLAPSFPTYNKPVVFFKPQNLSYNTLKDVGVVDKLNKTVTEIVSHHTQLGHSGIVLVPSFKLAEGIISNLSSSKTKIFYHERGQKLADLLKQFIQHERVKPSVLITPSGFEGLDLSGDLSRYVIMVKAPWLSLADKRSKVIMERYPDIYSTTTLMKLVQGAGRGVRSPEDWAITYALDAGIKRLWAKNVNPWFDEFETVYGNVLLDGPMKPE